MLTQEQATTLDRKIEKFSEILAKNPGDGLTVLALAEASFRRGLKLEALTAYQTVTKGQSVPEAHLAVAEIYSQQNMTTEAYGELRRLFQLDPENVEARLLIRILERQSPPPDDIQELLRRPASDEAFHEARLRLQIQRAIHNRELQERTRNGTLEPGIVIHEYYIEEAKKKLIEVDEQLRKLDDLKAHNATLNDPPPKPELVSPQLEMSLTPEMNQQLEEEFASAIHDLEQDNSSGEIGEQGLLVDTPSGEFLEVSEGETHFEISDLEPAESYSQEDASYEGQTPEISEFEDQSLPSSELEVDDTESEQASELLVFSEVEEGSESDGPDQSLPSNEFDLTSEVVEGESLQIELEDYSPLPESESFEETPASLEETSIDLSIPLEVVLDPELPDIDEELIMPIQVGSADEMPMPSMSDSRQSLEDSDERVGFGVPPAIEPLSFEESVEEYVAVESVEETLVVDEVEIPEVVEEIGLAVEPESPAVVPGNVSRASAAERQAYYESKAEEIGKLTGTLARTRGVSSIFLVARDGTTLDSVVKDDITESRVGELVKESFEFLLAYADAPAYWVLECAGGIFVMQTLDSEHVLIAIGQAGANFGALRYTMDKTKSKFEAILQHVPR